MAAFKYEIAKDNIAIVTMDLPGEKVNKLTTPVMDELSALLDTLAGNRTIKAMVFISGKEGTFIAGADIAEIRDITDRSLGEELSRRGQAVLQKMESLPFPTVAAINGACLGGGLELALACRYRVVTDDPKTVLGLPEVKIGIMPGFGGTQRLPRLVGLMNSLDAILTGKSIYPKKAGKIGLADDVTHRESLLPDALSLAKKAIGRPRPDRLRARRSLLVRILESNALTRSVIYSKAKSNIRKETRGNYPGPLAALEAVKYGLAHGLDAGYRKEAELIAGLMTSEVSKNLIHVFYLSDALKKSKGGTSTVVSRAGVIGAGVMGGGIAQLFAEKGIDVRMKDINTKFVGIGMKTAAGIFAKRSRKGVLTRIQARDGMDRITGTTDLSGLGSVDIAVEAVVENMEVKKSVLRDFETTARSNAIFASNTSSLSITEMASASKHPDRIVGMHFFNPVEKMPLVEIVRGKQTSDETVAAIAALSRRIGKLPVVVNDGPGFLVNRILMPYLGEAVKMLEQGGTIESIDGPLLRFGMPMGAFILLDEIGIDIAYKVADILHAGLGERVKPSPMLGVLARNGYLGKKNGKGFYLYTGKERSRPDPSINGYVTKAGAASGLTVDEIVERAMLLMIKEAALCLEEKIIDRPDHLDAALIFGIGFPPFRGGLLRYADTLGAKVIVDTMESYAKKYGDRFLPPASIIKMAQMGTGFYR